MDWQPIETALKAAAYALDHDDENKAGASTSAEELAGRLVAAFLHALSDACEGGALTFDCGQGCGPHTIADTLPLAVLALVVEGAAPPKP